MSSVSLKRNEKILKKRLNSNLVLLIKGLPCKRWKRARKVVATLVMESLLLLALLLPD